MRNLKSILCWLLALFLVVVVFNWNKIENSVFFKPFFGALNHAILVVMIACIVGSPALLIILLSILFAKEK